MGTLPSEASAETVTRWRLLQITRRAGAAAVLQRVLDGCYVAAVVYLCAAALNPALTIGWFGAPGSSLTILVVLALPIAHLVVAELAGQKPLSGPPLVALAATAVSALALGISAYWRCQGGQSVFFAPLTWTLGLFLGSVENPFDPRELSACAGHPMPVALELARLLAISTTLATALTAALTLFRSQLDRIAIWRARSLTVVIGVDDDTVSMIRAIAGTIGRGEALVALTANGESSAARTARDLGAKLRVVNLDEHERISALPLWRRLVRLYLLSDDPVRNLKRFGVIDAEVVKAREARVRLPLIVRIDDPWQAEVWRRRYLATAERRWVADAVGRYEITAAKLVRHLSTCRPGANEDELERPATVMLCGLQPLTLAMASALAQSQRDQELFAKPTKPSSPTKPAGPTKPSSPTKPAGPTESNKARVAWPANVIVFARGAPSFVADHQMRQGLIAPDGSPLAVTAIDEEPTVDAITEYLRARNPATHAVVLGDPGMEMDGTRLASRFPSLRVYAASGVSTALVDFSIVGHLYTFPINMELDPDAAQDVWERAAELIHEHYRAGADPRSPAAKPWKDLDPFFKHSNRRQVLNTLWMVEALANHTWDFTESGPAAPFPSGFADMEPLQQLAVLGFDESTVHQMVKTEHEDWCRYYREAGWLYAEVRDDKRRRHDKLVPYERLALRDDFVEAARRSLVGTLINLRFLGYRSVPKAAQHPSDQALQDVG